MEDYCNRCGAFAEGASQWMFHSGSLPAKEFYCTRCRRVLRIYAIVGFTLLGLLLVGLCSAVVILKFFV